MIVVDIETSGLDSKENGLWQIGALDFYNPDNTFLEESRIDDEDQISKEALLVIGKTEEQLRDSKKQSQKELLEKFFKWIESVETKNIVCQNFFDYIWLTSKAKKYDLKVPFHHRSFDLHSIAQAVYAKTNGNFLFEKKENTYSGMNLTKILEFCGMEDKRIKIVKGEITEQGSPHNALEDVKLEAECLSRLIYGKKFTF